MENKDRIKYLNRNLVDTYLLKVCNEQRLDLLDDIIHQDYQVEELFSPLKLFLEMNERIEGSIDGIKNRLRRLLEIGRVKFTDLEYFQATGSMAVRCKCLVKHIGSFLNIPASGVTVEVMCGFYFRFKDDKIVKIDVLIDSLKLLVAVGAATMQTGTENDINEYLTNVKELFKDTSIVKIEE